MLTQSVSGAGTTTYGYDAAGHTTSVSGPSQSQSMSWDDAGRLSSDTITPSGGSPSTASYLYDASGNLLIQSDPGSATLYLGDEELVLSTATGTVTGTRFYTIGGNTVAARTSAGAVDYLIGDEQGTSTLAIDSSTLTATRRYYDPYGNPAGAAPASWPGARGFVGGTTDAATGLVNLGAREYSPASSAFISPDPLLDPANPQDLNPYAYAADNPSTNENPSGAMFVAPGGGGGGSTAAGGGCPLFDLSCHNGPPLVSGGGGGGGGGGGRGTAASPVVRISAHVYAFRSDPQVRVLRQAWQWVVRNYGQPHSAGAEFSDWIRACGFSPDRTACTGQFGEQFNGMFPHYAVEGAFGMGLGVFISSIAHGTVAGLVIGAVSYGPSRQYLFRNGGVTRKNATPRSNVDTDLDPEEWGLSMTQDPAMVSKRSFAIDSAKLRNLYVVLDPAEADPQHVLIRTATYQETVEWAATRDDPETTSRFTSEVLDAIMPSGVPTGEGAEGAVGGE